MLANTKLKINHRMKERMGLPLNNMAAEPWNKVNIPYPCATASCKITFNEKTAGITESVVLHCESVLMLLNSEVFQTEIRVLQKILYVMHNSFRQHKPYCAIKQVEQCVKRLNEMKLQGALQDLHEVCPNPIQREVGVDVGHCDVPSQPMLEWFCLKLLGASHLLIRTMDLCTKAFLLSKQHLGSEFIVLNLLLVSMLSRLWVFFRGILRALVPVYQSTKDLLHHVVQYRPMPYLTDFTLPGDLAAFLGPTHSDLLNEKAKLETLEINGATKLPLLNRLFEEGAEEQRMEGLEQMGMMQVLADKSLKPNADLGKAILRQGPYRSSSPSVLDIKSILHQSPGICPQSTAEMLELASPAHQVAPSLAVLDQKRAFLKLLKTASSFSEVAIQLEEMMGWCRRCKLHQERCSLAFILLRCRKMQAMECKGIRVQRKLKRIYLKVHQVLKGASQPRPSSSKRRTKSLHTARFLTLMARYGSVRERIGMARKQSCLARDLFGVNEKSTHKCRKSMKPVWTASMKKVVSGIDISQKDKKMDPEMTSVKSSNVNNEIDDIFASVGL